MLSRLRKHKLPSQYLRICNQAPKHTPILLLTTPHVKQGLFPIFIFETCHRKLSRSTTDVEVFTTGFLPPAQRRGQVMLIVVVVVVGLGGRLSVQVPAFEPDTENDSVWVSYFLTTPLQGCVRAFLFFLPNFEYLKKF